MQPERSRTVFNLQVIQRESSSPPPQSLFPSCHTHSGRTMLPKFSRIPVQRQEEPNDMGCQSDDESGIIRALAMSASENENTGRNARMNEALKLRQKMHPSGRRTMPILSPRHTPSMFDDDEEEGGESGEGQQERIDSKSGVKNGENVEPNRGDRCVKRGGISRRGGRSALLARLNLKNNTPQKEEKRMTSSQFQNQLSSRFKTTKHQVRKLASSDTEE